MNRRRTLSGEETDARGTPHYHVWVGRGHEIARLAQSYRNRTQAQAGLRELRDWITRDCRHPGELCCREQVNGLRLDFSPGHAVSWLQAMPCTLTSIHCGPET